ncbi:MAG TPA: DUF308 domain-containing protein [Clostridiaceae bacterium]|jgi:membrane protein|nr:DUF308 domain-containing protein [Clostridiaceae bacterium]
MNYIEKIFKKSGLISILESLIIALLGIILIIEPEGTLEFITCSLGVIFILAGLYKIINYFLSKGKYNFYDYDLAYGLVACIIGIITIICGAAISSVFRIIIGIWIIYSAFIRIDLSVKFKAVNSNAWIFSLILSILMFICGLYVTINSGAILVTVGTIMVVYSIIDIIEAIIFMKNIKEIF